MNLVKSAILGLVQGIAEFLPISSSGHLNILQALFGMTPDLLVDILLHVGTLFAVLVVFWRDWLEMLRHPIKNKTLALLIVASLPALIAKVADDKLLGGLFFGEGANSFQTTNALLGVCFLITGALLLFTQRLSVRRQQRGIEERGDVSFANALAMGCMQAVGMLPGISRSGSTIFGGVASGSSRESAAKFSFMMSAPAIVGSLLSGVKTALETPGALSNLDIPGLAVGMVVAALSGYLSIRFFLKLIKTVSLGWFALYVALVGILVLALQSLGVMTSPDVVTTAETAARLWLRRV